MFTRISTSLFVCLGLLGAAPVSAATWNFTFETGAMGPLEMVADFERQGDTAMFAASGLELQFACAENTCDATTGGGNLVQLTISEGSISGSVEGGALAGSVAATPSVQAIDDPLRDYPALANEVVATLRANVFDPARLDTEAFGNFEQALHERARQSHNDLEFLRAVRDTWREANPFSHVRLVRSHQSVDELAAFFDVMRLGYDVARLEWNGDTAILTVDSMMGVDTIEQIEAAYAEIAARSASALIIDIRENGGGAFAIKPLIEHVINEPQSIGYFLSRAWTEHHDNDPTAAQIAAVAPWEGWSIVNFWADVLDQGVIRLEFSPVANNFDGPVYVLVSGNTASAAEIAADALQASGQAVIVGEQTNGAVLSQSMFDLSDGFQLSLPIADYVSIANGRLEGAGVQPDVSVPAEDAMETALELVARP